MLAGLHALFALTEQVGFACEALVAVLSDAGLTGRVAWLAFLPRLVLVGARGAFCHAGAICTNRHT